MRTLRPSDRADSVRPPRLLLSLRSSRPRSSTLRLSAIVAGLLAPAVVATLAGCGGHHSSSSPTPTPTPTATPTPAASATPTPTSSTGGDAVTVQ